MRRLLRSGLAATSRLSEVEIASALARRCREGSFAPAERDRAFAALSKDFLSLQVVELVPAVVARGRSLLVRHSLRAGDAVQLASCLILSGAAEDVAFVGYDGRLNAAAEAEGVALPA